MELEACGLQQNDYFVEELAFLEQTVDGLCRDLDSLLQAICQQAADFDSLLDVKTRLEAEIQVYMRLLDGQSPLGYEMMIMEIQPISNSLKICLWFPILISIKHCDLFRKIPRKLLRIDQIYDPLSFLYHCPSNNNFRSVLVILLVLVLFFTGS